MYENQIQDQCGPAPGIGYGSIRSREDEQQAKYAEHVKMERMHRDARMSSRTDEGERQHEVPEQIARMGGALDLLEKTATVLEERLAQVVRPNGPQPAGDTKLASAPPATAYGTDLYDRVQRAHRIADRLQDLIRRLEV